MSYGLGGAGITASKKYMATIKMPKDLGAGPSSRGLAQLQALQNKDNKDLQAYYGANSKPIDLRDVVQVQAMLATMRKAMQTSMVPITSE